MIPPKDGTSWAALEYLRYLEGTPENGGKKNGRKAVVVPVALCYTEKSKFRSRVVVQYVSLFFICSTCARYVPAGTMVIADNADSTADMYCRLCEPITMDSFEEQFLSDKEGESRLAVKRLTRTIEMALWRHTVNAPDWSAVSSMLPLLTPLTADLAIADSQGYGLCRTDGEGATVGEG
jgi:hypothetical protein